MLYVAVSILYSIDYKLLDIEGIYTDIDDCVTYCKKNMRLPHKPYAIFLAADDYVLLSHYMNIGCDPVVNFNI